MREQVGECGQLTRFTCMGGLVTRPHVYVGAHSSSPHVASYPTLSVTDREPQRARRLTCPAVSHKPRLTGAPSRMTLAV
jgi:hypothetical protein